MKFSKHVLLIELKRKMSYKLQDVMSSKFNIIKNIYELARLIQLKKDYYKRINDVKTRRRFDTIINEIIIAETRTKAIIIKTIFNIIINSINEKSQISFDRNFYSNTSRSTNSRTLNLDSFKEILIKEKKYFNCFAIDHISKNCLKSKKFKVAKMIINEKNSKKN